VADAQIVISANTRQAEAALKKMNGSLGVINRTAGLVAGALGAIVSVRTIQSIVQTTARFQDLRTALSSVTGSARSGANAFDFIAKFSTKTQFGVEELTETYIKLQAAGIEPTEKLLTTFTDTAAVTTDQLGSLQAITDLFSRTVSGGLGLEELNRLADRGIPVFRILEEQLGLTRLQVSEFGKTTEGAEKIRSALQKGLDASFGGATAQRVNNLSTQMSNLGIAFKNAQDAVGRQGFALALGETVDEITKVITTNDELVQKIGLGLTKAFLYAVEVGKLFIANIGLIGKSIGLLLAIQVVSTISSWAIAFGSTLVKGIALAIGALKALALAAIRHPLIGGIVLAIGGIEYFTGALSKLANKMFDVGEGGAIDGLVNKGKEFADSIVGPNGIVKGIDEFNQGMANVNDKAQDLQNKANAINDKVNGTNTALTTTNEKVTTAKKTYEEISLELDRQIGLTQAQASQNEIIIGLKEAELDLGRKLTDQEEKQLRAKLKNIEANKNLARATQQIKSIADDVNTKVTMTLDNQQKMLDDAEKMYVETYGNSLQSIEEFNRRREELDINFKNAELDREIQLYESKKQLAQKQLEFSKQQYAKQLQLQKGLFGEQVFTQERAEKVAEEAAQNKKKYEENATKFIIDQQVDAFTAFSTQSKKAFEAYKALKIAQAIMNTYEAATAAFASLAPIPFVGPVLGGIAAAAAVATGMAQVAAIRSQTYSGRALGGSVVGGQEYMVGERGVEIFRPSSAGTIIPNNQMGGGNPVTVNFNIQANDTAGFDELITSRKQLITTIIQDAQLEAGRRF